MIPVFDKFISDKNYKIPDVFQDVRTNKLKMGKHLSYYSEDLFLNINSKEELNKAI